ncbi:MAG: DNA repair protein RecN [Bdellovibrionia bacterium]
MLEVLKIKNIAIIDSAEIHFKKGLNIITGETGTGKSIVIEAISLLLGSRASTELIRAECAEAMIEGLFCISEIPWMTARLEQFGLSCHSSELLIKRIVHRGGRHRIYINGELATLAILQNVCEGLIDLCGQHEHQSLLKPSTQLDLLDRYGGLTELSKKLAALLSQVRSLRKESELLRKADQERKKKADFLTFQINEIQDANLTEGEEEQLVEEKHLLQSAENRAQMADAARQVLESDESGVLNSLKTALQKLRSLLLIDSRVKKIEEALERAALETEEVSIELNRYLDSVELNRDRLQIVQDRLSLIGDLRRKYGGSITEILANYILLGAELSSLGQIDARLDHISAELGILETQLHQQAQQLSKARISIQTVLANSVTEELKDLKMNEAKFLIELCQKENISDWVNSADTIQFLVQTNRGEPSRPLGKIASGGELSRLMLAIRRVIADRGGIGVYLFDEIDAGIGGQTAFEVGRKLKSVASYNQVICITHLPQVASFADHHLTVHKSVVENRTITGISELSLKERKIELARMLGGRELTKRSIDNACELIDLAAM